MPYVYRHIRLDKNEPFYIGIGSDDKGKHTRANINTNRNKHWKNIVAKTEYRIEILFDDFTWEEACEKEKEFIALYGRKDTKTGILCNMTDGGEGALGCIISQSQRIKTSERSKGKKMSFDERVEFNRNYLKRDLSSIDIEKIKKRMDNEFLKSSGQNNRKWSEEQKIKMSKMFSGINNPFYNKKHSNESKKKISQKKTGMLVGGKNPSAKLVINLLNGIFYECASDAAKSIGMDKARFRRMLAGTRINKTNFKYA